MEQVSIVVPVYNQFAMTANCVKDILLTYGAEIEIIVVDDCSKEPVSKLLPKLFPNIKVLRNDTNLGFAKTCNHGIREAKHDLICLLNNDIRLPNPSWLKLMIDSLQEYDLTAPAGGRMDKDWNYQAGEAKKKTDSFSYLAGWCILFKRDVINKIGMIPEDFGFGFFEDVLFCHRAEKAGFKMGITEGTQVLHLYHTTFKAEGYNISKEYMTKRKIFLNIIKKEG